MDSADDDVALRPEDWEASPLIMAFEHKLGSLTLTVLPEWLNVTDEIGGSEVPFTLARSEGTGVLQFSVASQQGGKHATIDIENLRRLLADFAESRELGVGSGYVERGHPTLLVGRSFDVGTRFVRVWYCSDGTDLALMTYNSECGQQAVELDDCEKMVSGVRFVRQ